MAEQTTTQIEKENIIKNLEVEKMVINCGAIDDKLEKSVKLLEKITGNRKIYSSSWNGSKSIFCVKGV